VLSFFILTASSPKTESFSSMKLGREVIFPPSAGVLLVSSPKKSSSEGGKRRP